MIKDKDFFALIKVFHQAVKGMVDAPTFEARKVIVTEWIELMGKVDRAMGGIMTENSREERASMVKDFEKILKEDFGYEDPDA